MPVKDRYAEDPNPEHCGHPNQRPVIVDDERSPSGQSTAAECDACGSSWRR